MITVGAVIDGKFQPFVRKGQLFEGRFVPKKGADKVMLAVRWESKDPKVHGFLQYGIE